MSCHCLGFQALGFLGKKMDRVRIFSIKKSTKKLQFEWRLYLSGVDGAVQKPAPWIQCPGLRTSLASHSNSGDKMIIESELGGGLFSHVVQLHCWLLLIIIIMLFFSSGGHGLFHECEYWSFCNRWFWIPFLCYYSKYWKRAAPPLPLDLGMCLIAPPQPFIIVSYSPQAVQVQWNSQLKCQMSSNW